MSALKVYSLASTLFMTCLLSSQAQTVDVNPQPIKEAAEDVLPASTPTEKKSRVPMIVGWKEWILMGQSKNLFHAKLDTGARTCSIHATNIEELELDGENWVKFTVSDTSDENASRYRYKVPVTRVARIKNDTGGLDSRFVVMLPFRIGGQDMEAEFTLNDRSEMNCAVLIGRNVLKKLGAVDSGRKNLLGKPSVPKKLKKAKKKTKL